MRRHIRRGPSEADGLSQLPAASQAILSRAALREECAQLREAIEELPELDRQVMVLRGIEQLSNQEAAELMGQSANAVSLRYNRVLKALRQRFGGSVLEELD